MLATVAMNFTFGDNGLITKAQQAKELTEIATVKEQLEMAGVGAFVDGEGTINPDDYFSRLEDEGIILDKDQDVIDNGDGTYEVTTQPDGYVFEITITEDGSIIVEEIGKGENIGPRIRQINITGKTDNSVSVEVLTKYAEDATYTYSYKKEGESSWTDASSNSSTYTFSNLENGVSYDIKVTVTNDLGSSEKQISVIVGKLPMGVVQFGNIKWNAGKASVTVSTEREGFDLQYQIGNITEGNWTTIANGGTIDNLSYGQTVYARLWDGANESEPASITVDDQTVPVVTVTPGGTTSNSITVSTSVIDNESGMTSAPTYTYSIKESGQEDSSYTTPSGANAISSNTYKFTGLTQGKSYDVRVQVNGDLAGNIGTGTLPSQTTESIPGGETGVEQGAIQFGSVSWSNGAASVAISTNTTYTIQYQVDSISESGWKTGNSVSGLSHGQTVFARLWDGTNGGEEASIAIEDNNPPTITNISLEPTDTTIKVTVTAADNESGVSTYTYAITGGATASNQASNTYTFTGLNSSTSYEVTVTVADKAGHTAQDSKTVSTTTPPIYVDSVLPSAPELSDGMTPVKWNGSNWIKTTEEDSEWYNYANKQWANVVLGDASWNGNTLNESQPYSMLVWIPRYAYQITSQYHQSGSGAGNINIVFIDTNNQNKAKTQTYSESYPSVSGSSMSSYVVHPAFNYGGTKLPGFWVGKYETSNTAQTTGNNTTYTAMIKAGVPSWRSIQVSNIFTVCTNMNSSGNPYGLNTSDSVVDPHMMKNSEWGAVAYLSRNTTYGKGSEVWINNSSTYITGNAGNSVSAGSASGVTNAYNTGNGPQASTTGNVTGVYDMSGGAWEYVAGYVNNGNGNLTTYGSTLVNAADKYKDVYKVTSDGQSNNYNNSQPTTGLGKPTKDTGHYGDAVWETSSSYSGSGSWYSDYSYFPYSSLPFFLRGGYCNATSNAGVFDFGSVNGSYDSNYSFRVVLPVL